MSHDWIGVAKIALVATASSLLLTLIVGFYDSSSAAKRALPWLFLLCALVGTLQVIPTSVLVLVLGGFAMLGLLLARWQRTKK